MFFFPLPYLYYIQHCQYRLDWKNIIFFFCFCLWKWKCFVFYYFRPGIFHQLFRMTDTLWHNLEDDFWKIADNEHRWRSDMSNGKFESQCQCQCFLEVPFSMPMSMPMFSWKAFQWQCQCQFFFNCFINVIGNVWCFDSMSIAMPMFSPL